MNALNNRELHVAAHSASSTWMGKTEANTDGCAAIYGGGATHAQRLSQQRLAAQWGTIETRSVVNPDLCPIQGAKSEKEKHCIRLRHDGSP